MATAGLSVKGMASIVQLIGPKPPDVDLSDNITPRDNAVCIAMVTIAFLSVILRFYTRRRLQGVDLEIDDWAVAISLVGIVYFGDHKLKANILFQIPLIALLAATIIGEKLVFMCFPPLQ